MEPGDKPLLVWDGECGFCRHWVGRWMRHTGDRVEYAVSSDVGAGLPQVPAETFQRTVVLVEPDGSWFTGADAVFRAFAHGPERGQRVPLWLYRHVPGVALVTEWFYALVASHRMVASRLTKILVGQGDPGGFAVSSWIFLRLLALVFLAAFVSLWVQVDGLIGSHGILPIAPFVDAARDQLGPSGWLQFPTLCWWDPSDRALDVLCGGGVALSLMLLLGVAPVPVLVMLWAFYLSLVTAGRTFLTFQWDTLLIETAFLAILCAPLTLAPTALRAHEPRRVARWLLWWLVFRLHFMSGVVKILANDPTWRDLTALVHHHETQPLPTWVAWHVHHLPPWALKAACAGTFVVELALPFFIWAPRRLRHFACLGMLALQAGVFVTGNYGFFNVLTAALCVTLLDDGAWPARLRARIASLRATSPRARWPLPALVPVAFITLLLTTVAMLARFDLDVPWPRPVAVLRQATAPLLTWNGYGLFADMTTERFEIVVEGSEDGLTWRELEFRYKPGDLSRRPPFLQPHMPRLDWRMCFAALGPYQASPWLERFELGILRGEPDVIALLATNPFPERPPRHVRSLLYVYRFTDGPTRRATGQWWRREFVGPFAPPVTLAR